MTKPSLREQLESELGDCLASDLKAHLERGAVVIVAPEIPLIDAAQAVAEDDADSVKYWIEKESFRRPKESEMTAWSDNPELKFRSVIVRPYVLVQPVLD